MRQCAVGRMEEEKRKKERKYECDTDDVESIYMLDSLGEHFWNRLSISYTIQKSYFRWIYLCMCLFVCCKQVYLCQPWNVCHCCLYEFCFCIRLLLLLLSSWKMPCDSHTSSIRKYRVNKSEKEKRKKICIYSTNSHLSIKQNQKEKQM